MTEFGNFLKEIVSPIAAAGQIISTLTEPLNVVSRSVNYITNAICQPASEVIRSFAEPISTVTRSLCEPVNIFTQSLIQPIYEVKNTVRQVKSLIKNPARQIKYQINQQVKDAKANIIQPFKETKNNLKLLRCKSSIPPSFNDYKFQVQMHNNNQQSNDKIREFYNRAHANYQTYLNFENRPSKVRIFK